MAKLVGAFPLTVAKTDSAKRELFLYIFLIIRYDDVSSARAASPVGDRKSDRPIAGICSRLDDRGYALSERGYRSARSKTPEGHVATKALPCAIGEESCRKKAPNALILAPRPRNCTLRKKGEAHGRNADAASKEPASGAAPTAPATSFTRCEPRLQLARAAFRPSGRLVRAAGAALGGTRGGISAARRSPPQTPGSERQRDPVVDAGPAMTRSLGQRGCQKDGAWALTSLRRDG